jgi:hypothetical protein
MSVSHRSVGKNMDGYKISLVHVGQLLADPAPQSSISAENVLC